jgi:predicted transcriptional regulator
MKEVMNLQEKKLELVQLILNTEKPAILEKVEAVLKKEDDVDWWDELSEDERKAIEQGIKEADNGELKSHAEVLKERKAKYKLDQ